MKKLILAALMLPVLAVAQTKGDRVYITDPTKVQKQYTFRPEDEKVINKNLEKAEIAAIKATCHPGPAWPRSIQAPTGYKMNVDSIKKYEAYFVIALPFGQSIVKVPVEGNEGMSEFLRPKKDFYFVIDTPGISTEEPEQKKK